MICTHCPTQIIVVRAPSSPVRVTCGPDQMRVLGPTEPRPLDETPSGSVGVQAGRHYSDPQAVLELLCIQDGVGPIAVDGRTLVTNQSISR